MACLGQRLEKAGTTGEELPLMLDDLEALPVCKYLLLTDNFGNDMVACEICSLLPAVKKSHEPKFQFLASPGFIITADWTMVYLHFTSTTPFSSGREALSLAVIFFDGGFVTPKTFLNALTVMAGVVPESQYRPNAQISEIVELKIVACRCSICSKKKHDTLTSIWQLTTEI